MFGLYPLSAVLYGFCLYHAYTNKSDAKWYLLILFLPVIGSLIYIYYHFLGIRKLENISEGIKESLVTNYKIDKLEQKVQFSDTYSNKLELAKEHIILGNNQRAIEILESCLTDNYRDDPSLNTYLLQAHYQNENYNAVVEYGDKMKSLKEFHNSNEMTAYAWASFKIGDVERARDIFIKMDIKYSNYLQRLEYAYFLKESNANKSAKVLIDELMQEINAMDSYERRLNKEAINKIKYLRNQLNKEV